MEYVKYKNKDYSGYKKKSNTEWILHPELDDDSFVLVNPLTDLN